MVTTGDIAVETFDEPPAAVPRFAAVHGVVVELPAGRRVLKRARAHANADPKRRT